MLLYSYVLGFTKLQIRARRARGKEMKKQLVCHTSADAQKNGKAHAFWGFSEEELGPSRSSWKYSCLPRCAPIIKAVPKLTDKKNF